MTMTLPTGELGGPVYNGLELRDAMNGVFTDIDEGNRQVKVEFPHETVDSYRTVFGKDAFRESFARRSPVMCWQHQLAEPIGHAIKAQVTPTHNEVVGQFSDFDAVPLARRAFTQISDGTLGDFSFGFKNAKYEPAGELGKGVRRIKEAHMAEFSPVTIGSIPGAKAVGLREDGDEVMELTTIMELRKSGLITVRAEAELIKKYHPELAEHITVRDITGDDMDADDPSGAAAEDEVAPREWEAQDAGLHTATGPNDEAMRVAQHPDGQQWSVMSPSGVVVAMGVEADVPTAKRMANEAVGDRADAADLVVPDSVTAADVRAVITEHAPGMAAMLSNYAIAVGLPTDPIFTRGIEDNGVGHSMVVSADSALSSAVEWLSDVQVEELPNEVQQSLALTRAAAEALDIATAVLGLRDPDDEDLVDEDEDLPDLEADGLLDDEDDDDDEQESAADARAQAMAVLDRRLAHTA